MVGNLYGKDRLTYIGVGKEAGQFPLIPEAIPQRTWRWLLGRFEYGTVGSLDIHHTYILGHTALYLACSCEVAMNHVDVILILFHSIYQLRLLGLRRWEEDMDSLSSSSDRGTGFLREDSSHLSSSSR